MTRPWFRLKDRLHDPRLGMLILALCLGYSAQAAIRAIIAHPLHSPAPQQGPSGYEAEDHFPGAAYFYAADDSAAPSAGTTGTTALPDLPVPAGTDAGPADGSIRPARPFSMRLASPLDRARATECLTAAIYYEAATEPDAGQRAVAQVILNRVRHPAFPATVCGVVYQGSERAGCQFSFACDGAVARRPDPAMWRRAMAVAIDALSGRVSADVGMATHYHTYAVTPAWNRQLVMTAAIGAHFFHRWQGWWGTPAAFSQIYRGGEPEPGPHPRALDPATTGPLPPVVLASAGPVPAPPSQPAPAPAVPDIAAASVQPGYVQAGAVLPRYATGGSIAQAAPGGSDGQILDKWKDSGKPLR